MNMNRRTMLKSLLCGPLAAVGALAPRLAGSSGLEMWLLQRGQSQLSWLTFSGLLDVLKTFTGR